MKRSSIKRFGFRNKLIVSFVLVSLLPVLLLQMISYYVSTEAMKKKVDDLVQVNLLQTSKNLETSLNAYEDILFQIFTDDNVIQLVKEINNPHTDSLELSRRKLINILSNYSYAKKGIRSVAIFTSSGTLICYDQQTGSPYENLWSDMKDLRELPIYREAMARKAESVMSVPVEIDTFNNKELYGFHIAKKLSDLNAANLEGIGVAVITVYESILANAIELIDPDSQSPKPIENQSYLTDNEGQIVSSSDKKKIGLNIEDVMQKSSISNVYHNQKSGLNIYNLIDQNELFQEMYSMQRLSIGSGIVALLVSGILIYYFSGSLSRSILKVVRAMKVAQQGTLSVQVEDETHDEISAIAFSFNKMMITINDLMGATKQAVEKQKEAEIRALEAQINPHFLYNTLDSINWIAIEKEEHQISQMLKGLAQILRYSIKDSNKPVTVKEELEWMNHYIFLQQYRFRSSFNCTVEYDESALHLRIHKLLLQPFIENSIIHGFAGMKQGGILLIRVEIIDAHTFSLLIKDNGKGMEEDKMKAIFASGDKGSNEGMGLGIRNVFERLHIYYGSKATWNTSSEPGQGTAVRIYLPIITDKEQEE